MASETEDPKRFSLTFEHLVAWCDRQQYTYRSNVELRQLAIDYTILGQPAPLLLLPQPDRGMLMLLVRLPVVVPAGRRMALIDATSQLNGTSYMGTWVVNRDTGEVLFRVTLPALDNAYSDAGLLHAARVVVGTVERLAATLKAIAVDGADPTAALAAS